MSPSVTPCPQLPRTALLDVMALTWNELKPWSDDLRIIVLLTDGVENASNASINEALTLIASEPRYSTFIFGLAYGADADEGVLSRCCQMTGGSVFEGNLTNISKVFAAIARVL